MPLDDVLQITDEGFDSGPDDLHRLTVGVGPGEQAWNYSVVGVSHVAQVALEAEYAVGVSLGDKLELGGR